MKTPMPWLAACAVSLAATLPTQALTPAEADSILYLKQEEKVARDVYQALAVRWDQATFRNIALSEQRHMDAVDGLIARYDLNDTTPAEAGKFSIPDLQKLYDELLAQGQASLTAALQVGVAVEEADIADLKEAIALSTEAPVLRVFGNLLRASTQHLTAFNTALTTGTTSSTCGARAADCPNAGECTGAACGSGPQGRRMGKGGQGQGLRLQDGTCPMSSGCTGNPATRNGSGGGASGPNQPVTTPNRGGR